jgi:hypothetical protein
LAEGCWHVVHQGIRRRNFFDALADTRNERHTGNSPAPAPQTILRRIRHSSHRQRRAGTGDATSHPSSRRVR